jgi:hypothetical protein
MNKNYPDLESEKNFKNKLYFEVDTREAIYTGSSLKEIINQISDDLDCGDSANAYSIECYFSRYNQKVLSDKYLQIFNKFLTAKLNQDEEKEDEKDPFGFDLARKELQDQLM